MRDTLRRESGHAEAGRISEYLVILLTFAVLGGALAWAFTSRDDAEPTASTATSTTVDPLTPATLPPPKDYKVSDGVNIRGAPTTTAPVVGQVETGKSVTVVCRTEGQSVTSSAGSTNQWLRVTIGETPGYVSALYVDTGNDIDDPALIGICGPA